MPTYLYCLLSAGSDPPPAGLAGHAGRPVRALAAGDVVAWVSDIDDAPLERTAAAARRHDAVCQAALAARATPLPARFGQRFASDEACVADVRQREGPLRARLAAVAGCVEMTVHVPADAPAAAPELDATSAARAEDVASGGPGRRHLERLRRVRDSERNVHRQASATAGRWTRAAGTLVREEQVRRGAAGEIVIAHLVAMADLPAYRRALETMRDAEGTRAWWSGPYVPYSFTA